MARRIQAVLLAVLSAILLVWTPSAVLAGGSLIKIAESSDFRPSVIPYLFGRSRSDAAAQAQAAGFTPRFVGAKGPDATVVAQSIEAGQQRPRGTVIALRMGMVDGGGVTAPRLLGLNREAASSRAEASGLKPLFYGPNEPGTLVASQSVPAGQQVARGTYIQLQLRAPVASVRMPSFANLPMEEARALAATSRLRPIFSGDEGQGSRVVAQTPPAGAETNPGAEVELRLGVPQTRVPRFTGRSRAGAMGIAAQTGLTLDISGDGGDAARVARQTPSPGTNVAPGSHVAVVMAPAPAPQTPGGVVIPQLIGLTRAAAIDALGQSNLRGESTGSAARDAIVVSQDPPAATNAASGDVVRIVLSVTPPLPVTVPNVGNASRSTAVAALRAAGFVPTLTGDIGASARVASQQPAAGTTAPRGSSVTLTFKTGGGGGWIAPLVGLVLVGGAAGWIIRRRPKPDPDPTPGPTPEPKPTPISPVTYVAVMDAGRPTARFASEPTFAARALTLPRTPEERQP